MRPALRSLACVVVIALLGSSCVSPRTRVELPACGDRFEVGGQHRRISKHVIELDHTWDVPFTETVIELADKDGKVRAREVLANDHPEPIRTFAGVVVGALGGLLLASVAYDTLVDGKSLLDERPFYFGLWGAGSVVLASSLVLTGWHPDGGAQLDGMCD